MDEIRIIIRHIAGARATEIDIIPLGPHRELILGRAPSAAIRFHPRHDPAVGRYHARIEQDPTAGSLGLKDLGSRNGTFLNGRRIHEAVPLVAGDRIRLGRDGPEIEIRLEISVNSGSDG